MSVLLEGGRVVEMTVAKDTNVHSLAVSISRSIQEQKVVRLVAIGANAVNQMSKAGAKARAFVATAGMDLYWKLFMIDRTVPPPAGFVQPVGVAPDAMIKVSAVCIESRIG